MGVKLLPSWPRRPVSDTWFSDVSVQRVESMTCRQAILQCITCHRTASRNGSTINSSWTSRLLCYAEGQDARVALSATCTLLHCASRNLHTLLY